MQPEYSQIHFHEPSAARANLAILESRLPKPLWNTLPILLAQLPSPDDALNFLERYSREASSAVMKHLETHPASLHYLLAIFSHSRFLSESLVQQPELIRWLDRRSASEGLERLKSREDLLEECYRFATMSFELAPSVVLARFKRREYLRITLRDILGIATLAQTTLELSDLADVLIERALRLCAQRLENSYGLPQWADAKGQRQTARLTVISLGKLGGDELNYSSDIDVMFLYDRDGQTAGGRAGSVSNLEYFVRLAQAILKMLSAATPEGAVFRVDLRLRPEGQQGDLALSLPSALDYYRARAREWELQMLIKARVSAGEGFTGETFLREVQPLIYRQGFHLGTLEAVLNAREEISRSLRREASIKPGSSAEWNVKLSPGGIRDIEFLTQCLQRLHGGRDPWLTGRGSGSTLVALQRLHDKGYLSQRDFYRLSSAYQFLRKVEHRLQLRDGLQEHTLPEKISALDRLARRCGIEGGSPQSPGGILKDTVFEHFGHVRDIYSRILPETWRKEGVSRAGGAQSAPPEIASQATGDILAAGLRGAFPEIASRLEQIRQKGDSFTRRGVEKFLSSARHEAALLREMEERPEWLDRAALLFGSSDLVAAILARDPCAIREAVGAAAQPVPSLPFPASMASLRVEHNKAVLHAVSQSLLGESTPFDTFAALTCAAEQALVGALPIAIREEGSETVPDTAPFVVLALGRLGSQEFDVGSDADLVFLADASVSANEMLRWRKVAERLMHIAGSYTREGLLLPIDTRLRPRGTEGEIVQSASYLRDYFSREAEGWEAATYLKARPIVGNLSLGASVIRDVHEIFRRRFSSRHGGDPRELARQLAHTRERLEREHSEGETGFKSSAGGFFDIEYISAYVALSHGIPEAASAHMGNRLSALEAGGALDEQQAATLRDAALFYRALDHAIRLVLGRPTSGLPDPAQLPRVTTLLARWNVSFGGDLTACVSLTRRRVRESYRRLFPTPPNA